LISAWADGTAHRAAIAEIEVNRRTGEIRVLHVYGALDPGLVVDPLSVEQQDRGTDDSSHQQNAP
jgi:CO/xanthine dehydrogenase Mo-binding subunit